MRVKSQYIISIIIFAIFLAIISASIVVTDQQVTQLNNEAKTATNIQTGASSLSYISNDYFLYQQSAQLSQWQNQFSSISNDLSTLSNSNLELQSQINTVNSDLQNAGSVFNSSALFIESAPRNESIRVLPAFQGDWDRLAVQNQALAFDASILSQSFSNQADQLTQTSTILILGLIGAFGVYFVSVYFVVYRRTLKSIANLQNGTKIIGAGNLNYSIDLQSNDEFGELSQAFNQMTTNLKTVTASKTDLEQAQASLRESEQRWATTLASIGDAVIATDLSGKILFMNGVAEELTGWTLNEASLKPVKEVFNIVNEQTRHEVEDPVSKVLAEGMIVGLANHTLLIRKNKTEVAIDDSGAPIKDKDGKTTGVVLIFRDITERKKAEEELRKAKENLEEQVQQRTAQLVNERKRLFAILETVPIMVCLLTPDYHVAFANRSFREKFGESEGRHCYDYCFGKTEPCGFCESYKPLETGIPHHWQVNGSDGSVIDAYDFPFTDVDGSKMILEMDIDITEQKRVEKQLKDSERLAAIGATAGMVGHDIRNPLQAITGDLYLAKTELSELPENELKSNALESLTEIEKNINYINKIVQDLQDYARPLNPRAQETNIKSVFNEILAKTGIPKNIKVTVEIENKAEKVMADPDYLKRIAANLTLNAVQAMPDGGKLTIHAYADKQTDDVLITVKDTGVGIPEAIKPKLFTPMMTTKSKGQGFGLAVIKRMTEALGGTVSFDSQEGKGTTFTVRLPLTKS